MRFSDWVDTKPRGTLTRLSRETGIDFSTLSKLRRGRSHLKTFLIAKRLSEATDGEVTIEDLCEPPAAEAQ